MNRAITSRHHLRHLMVSLLLAMVFLVFGFILVNVAQGSTQGAFIDSAFAATKLSSAKVTGIVSKTYTGTARKQSPKVVYKTKTLTKGTDYTLSYKNNVKHGTATVYIKGKGKYSGTLKRTFTIKRKSVANLTYSSVSTKAHTGKKVKPTPTVKYNGTKITRNKSYTLSYSNNVKVGTATITVKGKGNFTGTKKITFKIRYSLAKHGTATLARTSLPYTGSSRKPSVSVKYSGKTLIKNTNYKLTYSNCKSVGTATVKITGIGKYGFTIKKTYKITSDGGKVIDVSSYDGTITWSKVAKKVDVAILRSYRQLGNHIDSQYNANASGCEKYSLPYGAYGYMNYTSSSTAVSQADTLWSVSFSNGHKPLFLVLDIESSTMAAKGSSIATWTQAAMNELQVKAKAAGYSSGIKIGLYISNSYYSTYGFSTTAGKAVITAADFVWLPRYGKNTGAVPASTYEPNYDYDVWQYTSNGSVSGISTAVDISLIRKSGPNGHSMSWYMKR